MPDIRADSSDAPYSMTHIEELEGAIADSEELLMRMRSGGDPAVSRMSYLLNARLEQKRQELKDLKAGIFSRIGVRLTR